MLMKPSVPETGRVISSEDSSAVVMLEGGKSCKGCGAAKIGLCRSGGRSMFLTARNSKMARPGDQVMIGIDAKTRRTGFLLAYVIPLVAFIAGALAGNIIGMHLDLPSLDILGAFALLFICGAVSLTKLKALDRASRMEITRIVTDGEFRDALTSEEERLYVRYDRIC
jgi:positive regulator of sigma E activity